MTLNLYFNTKPWSSCQTVTWFNYFYFKFLMFTRFSKSVCGINLIANIIFGVTNDSERCECVWSRLNCINLQLMSNTTEDETGLEILLLKAWHSRTEFRSLLSKFFNSSSFTVNDDNECWLCVSELFINEYVSSIITPFLYQIKDGGGLPYKSKIKWFNYKLNKIEIMYSFLLTKSQQTLLVITKTNLQNIGKSILATIVH